MPDLFHAVSLGKTWFAPGTRFHTYPVSSMQGLEQELGVYSIHNDLILPWDWEIRRATWQEREQAFFDTNTYQRPPWYAEPFWIEPAGHYAHISLDDPTKIAFTENADKGERDIQTRMKPGKYLTKFFPDLTPKQVAFYAEWFVKGTKPAPNLGEVQFASTEEAIRHVYDEGPHSCMKHSHSGVEVYAAGDLSVAYIEDLNRPEGKTVIARALCWPEKKVYGRVYPTPNENWMTDGWTSRDEAESVRFGLEQKLRGMGFNRGDFEGARLLRKDDGFGGLIGPYLDGDHHYLIDRGTHLEITDDEDSADYDACCTDGTLDRNSRTTWSCDFCGDGYEDDEHQYAVYHGTRNGGQPRHYSTLAACSYCQENSSGIYYCEATEEHFAFNHVSSREVFTSTSGITETWNENYAEANAFRSDLNDEWYCNDLKVTLANGDEISITEFESDEGFTCRIDGKAYLSGDQSQWFPNVAKANQHLVYGPLTEDYIQDIAQ